MDDELDFENLDYGDLGDFNPDDFDEEALERELGLITESVNKKEVAAKPAVSQASSEPKAISKPSEAKAEPTKTDTREAAKETSSSANVGAKPSTTPPKATEPTTKPTSTVEPAKPTVAAAKPTVAAKADDKQSPSNVKGAVEEDTEKLKPKETRPTTPQARRSPYPRMQSGHGNYSQRNYMSQDMYAMGQQGYMMGMNMPMSMPMNPYGMPPMMGFPAVPGGGGGRIHVNPKFAGSLPKLPMHAMNPADQAARNEMLEKQRQHLLQMQQQRRQQSRQPTDDRRMPASHQKQDVSVSNTTVSRQTHDVGSHVLLNAKRKQGSNMEHDRPLKRSTINDRLNNTQSLVNEDSAASRSPGGFSIKGAAAAAAAAAAQSHSPPHVSDRFANNDSASAAAAQNVRRLTMGHTATRGDRRMSPYARPPPSNQVRNGVRQEAAMPTQPDIKPVSSPIPVSTAGKSAELVITNLINAKVEDIKSLGDKLRLASKIKDIQVHSAEKKANLIFQSIEDAAIFRRSYNKQIIGDDRVNIAFVKK